MILLFAKADLLDIRSAHIKYRTALKILRNAYGLTLSGLIVFAKCRFMVIKKEC
jgi:hypothetical protein